MTITSRCTTRHLLDCALCCDPLPALAVLRSGPLPALAALRSGPLPALAALHDIHRGIDHLRLRAPAPGRSGEKKMDDLLVRMMRDLLVRDLLVRERVG